jgi:hypothetical protein
MNHHAHEPQPAPEQQEPALERQELERMLRARITAILRLVQLEHQGQPIEPDGFRLHPDGGATCGE